jgi:DNA invertase Pin-like site-specific DNA recombinase
LLEIKIFAKSAPAVVFILAKAADGSVSLGSGSLIRNANTSTAVGKLMLTVLSGVAEFERDLILLRTNEGRVRARQSGIKFGPKFKLSPHQIEEIRRRREAGESCRFLARSYGVSPNTISRIRCF